MLVRIAVGVAALVGCLMAAAPVAEAQELAGTFDQLRVLVKRGDTISVTDAAGKEVTGKIVDLSPASLGLLVGKDRQEFPASDVSTIRQRRQDSLDNGAKWGFGVGLGLGLLGGLSIASEYDEVGVGTAIIASLFYAGLGAGVGVGFDAMVKTNQVIYARTTSTASRISVAPMLGRQRQGLAVSFRF